MFTKQELIKLWSNGLRRREFIERFKTWGVWFTQPELDLTFYKYDLPDGSRIITMEYLRKPHYGEKINGNNNAVVSKKHYLKLAGDYFNPSAASDYEIADHLKVLKIKLMKEMKENVQVQSEN